MVLANPDLSTFVQSWTRALPELTDMSHDAGCTNSLLRNRGRMLDQNSQT
jgi:hypothetical protein